MDGQTDGVELHLLNKKCLKSWNKNVIVKEKVKGRTTASITSRLPRLSWLSRHTHLEEAQTTKSIKSGLA